MESSSFKVNCRWLPMGRKSCSSRIFYSLNQFLQIAIRIDSFSGKWSAWKNRNVMNKGNVHWLNQRFLLVSFMLFQRAFGLARKNWELETFFSPPLFAFLRSLNIFSARLSCCRKLWKFYETKKRNCRIHCTWDKRYEGTKLSHEIFKYECYE